MKPIWERYDRRMREEKLVGFWILVFATLLALVLTFVYNIVCLVFVIVFGMFASIFLQGYARPKLERLLDDCKRAHKAEREFSVDRKKMYFLFLLFSSPYYFMWQICSLLIILGMLWENPVALWFMTSFPALFISAVILIPWREKWTDLGGTSSQYWRMHVLVYITTLAVAAIVMAFLILWLGPQTFFG